MTKEEAGKSWERAIQLVERDYRRDLEAAGKVHIEAKQAAKQAYIRAEATVWDDFKEAMEG